ncbi:hypothetical protein EJB05_19575, partial [Eragrostis curvula]
MLRSIHPALLRIGSVTSSEGACEPGRRGNLSSLEVVGGTNRYLVRDPVLMAFLQYLKCSLRLMASPSAAAEFSQETARKSLIAISQSIPETPLPKEVKTPISTAENGKVDDAAEKYRSKLMSITDLSSDAQPTQCPPENVAT